MRKTIRRKGKLPGALISKSLQEQAKRALHRPKAMPRSGWAEASREVAALGDDRLVLPEFANEGDGLANVVSLKFIEEQRRFFDSPPPN